MAQVIVNEQWRSISEYINYQVSNMGRVRNANTGKILKPVLLKSGYPSVKLYNNDHNKTMLIHRLVASEFIDNLDNKLVVDHIDHDKTNNIVTNLRWASVSQNQMNQQKLTNKGGYSKYKGVTWDKRRNKWMAKICKNYKTFHIGYFDSEEEASEAYNCRAVEMFEEFAQLNPTHL